MIILHLLVFSFFAYDFNTALENHYTPGIIINGIFGLLIFSFIWDDLTPTQIETVQEYNQDKYHYTFNFKNNSWLDLKDELKNFYQPYGFDMIIIDEINSWMLKSEKDKASYVYLSLKDGIIHLEVYNTLEPDLSKFKDSLQLEV